MAPVLVLVSFQQTATAEMIHVTPKNGVPSAWELVSVETDRIVVRKGGARFEFSRDNIETVSNPRVTKLLESARHLLDQVDQHDPETFPKLEEALEGIYPKLDQAAKYFDWVIPKLKETRDRVGKAKTDIAKTLELTETFQEDLSTIEKMAAGKAPAASNWEEVVQNTLESAREIPFTDIRSQVVSDIESFRRTIRLSLVRRTEEAEKRIRERSEAVLKKLENGQIDPEQWKVILRDLRRQVAEQVPDPDLRLELEEYLNGVEAKSAEKVAIAEEKIAQRQISEALDGIENLVLDTTQTEVFTSRAQEIAAQLANLADSTTKEELKARLDQFQSDHQEALAQLRRAQQPAAPAEPVESTPSSAETSSVMKILSDWRVLAGGGGGMVAIIGFLWVLSRKKKPRKAKSAAEIEDVEVVPVKQNQSDEGDLLSMLAKKPEPEPVAPAPTEAPSTAGSDQEDDPFGIAISQETSSAETASENFEMINSSGEIGEAEENPFGFSEEEPVIEESPEDQQKEPEPAAEASEEGEDPFGFSTVFSEESEEDSFDFLSSEAPSQPSEEAEDIFSATPQSAPPVPVAPEEPSENPAPESGGDDMDDPFGLLSTPAESSSEETSEPEIEDLFESPSPPSSTEEKEDVEDIFGFNDYFEDSDSDDSK